MTGLTRLNSNFDSYTMYAIEKSKSGTHGLHEDAFANTANGVNLFHYVNQNWRRPSY